jgi:hypothetical protein
LARASLGGPPARTVVFVAPPSEELERSLRDALTAQLSGGPAALVFEHFAQSPAPLVREMAEARTLASAHAATGVFWVDAQPDGDWLLYLSTPDGERTLVRRVEVEAGGASAAVEAVALIARQSTEALVSGGTIGMQSVAAPPQPAPSAPEPEPEPPPSRAPARQPRRLPSFAGVSFSGAYAGEYPVDTLGWQSGLTAAARYTFKNGIYLTAGYTFFRSAEVDVTPLVLRITRNPFYIEGGYSFGHGRWVPSVGGRAIVEVLSRHTVSTSGTLAGTPDTTRDTVFLSPRVRVDYGISPGLAAYGAVGVDFGLNRFSFVNNAGGSDRVLLEPNIVRPSIELGLSFWP